MKIIKYISEKGVWKIHKRVKYKCTRYATALISEWREGLPRVESAGNRRVGTVRERDEREKDTPWQCDGFYFGAAVTPRISQMRSRVRDWRREWTCGRVEENEGMYMRATMCDILRIRSLRQLIRGQGHRRRPIFEMTVVCRCKFARRAPLEGKGGERCKEEERIWK